MAYSAGPLNGYTGAPGELNCTYCHWTNPLNSGDGTLVLSGPPSVQAGQTYEISISLQDAGQQRWGFELTTQGVGSMGLADPLHTQLDEEFGYQYLKHTSEGTYAGTLDGPVGWTFLWTAPEAATPAVTFHVAGNAADGGGTEEDDYIYTSSLTLPFTLDPVTDLVILVTGGLANLGWSPVAGASAYRVERSGGMGLPFTPLALVATPGYLDSTAGSIGLYRVVAVQEIS